MNQIRQRHFPCAQKYVMNEESYHRLRLITSHLVANTNRVRSFDNDQTIPLLVALCDRLGKWTNKESSDWIKEQSFGSEWCVCRDCFSVILNYVIFHLRLNKVFFCDRYFFCFVTYHVFGNFIILEFKSLTNFVPTKDRPLSLNKNCTYREVNASEPPHSWHVS